MEKPAPNLSGVDAHAAGLENHEFAKQVLPMTLEEVDGCLDDELARPSLEAQQHYARELLPDGREVAEVLVLREQEAAFSHGAGEYRGV